MIVMSYNVRWDCLCSWGFLGQGVNNDRNPWILRREKVAKVINDVQPQFLGVQETREHQRNYILCRTGYRAVGEGRSVAPVYVPLVIFLIMFCSGTIGFMVVNFIIRRRKKRSEEKEKEKEKEKGILELTNVSAGASAEVNETIPITTPTTTPTTIAIPNLAKWAITCFAAFYIYLLFDVVIPANPPYNCSFTLSDFERSCYFAILLIIMQALFQGLGTLLIMQQFKNKRFWLTLTLITAYTMGIAFVSSKTIIEGIMFNKSANPIFFNPSVDDLKYVSSETVWLNPTKTRGEKGWDAMNTRIFTAANFKMVGGGNLLVINTHLDHVGWQSRIEGAKQIAEYINVEGGRAILMGDFNAWPNSEVWQTLTNAGLLDTFYYPEVNHVGPYNTFNGFDAAADLCGAAIDYVWVFGAFSVASHAALYFDHIVSDHNALKVSVSINEEEEEEEGQPFRYDEKTWYSC